jgi:hypothetical protein
MKGTMSAGTETIPSFLPALSLPSSFGTKQRHKRESPLSSRTSQRRSESAALFRTNGDSIETTLTFPLSATRTMIHPNALELELDFTSALVLTFRSRGYRCTPTASTGILAVALNKKFDDLFPFGISKSP